VVEVEERRGVSGANIQYARVEPQATNHPRMMIQQPSSTCGKVVQGEY